MPSFAIFSRSPDKTVLNGSTFLSFGSFSASAPTLCRQYITCEYIGCSTQVVPSWSNVAMRASDGTNFALPCVVVSFTNATIACFAGPVVPGRQIVGAGGGGENQRNENQPLHAGLLRRGWALRVERPPEGSH